LALPKLVADVRSGKEGKFDMVFIDGWHTFDYTLLDFFYADLLLKKNGVIMIDDIKHKGPAKTLKYILSNYPHYRLVWKTPCSNTLATLVKTHDDQRPWDFHKEF
jgi:predicted O-methyltransferase YrrM